jgi:OOP family OmpA-OmpF porin
MKHLLKIASIAAALAGAAAVQAQSLYVLAGGQPVTSAYGDPVRTGNVAYYAQILFGFDETELGDEARKVLDGLARRLAGSEISGVVAIAHADRLGEAHYNARLSTRRAEAVRAYLVEKGVPAERVHAEARGQREPLTRHGCQGLGAESRDNRGLVACLQPDRRVVIEIAAR